MSLQKIKSMTRVLTLEQLTKLDNLIHSLIQSAEEAKHRREAKAR